MDAGAEAESRGTVIAQFADESSAHMAAARLSADDIQAVVLDTLPTRALGVRKAALAVPDRDVSRAVAILKMTPAAPFLLPTPP
jgi:hypothetical protein